MTYSKELTDQCDLLISLGCRFAPTLCNGSPKKFAKQAYTISINNDKNELDLNLKKIDLKINHNLSYFLEKFGKFIQNKKINSYNDWVKKCLIMRMRLER